MSNIPLFVSDHITLLDDERGRIVYFGDRLPPERASEWFDRLQAGVRWRHERWLVHECEVDVPRMSADFALDEVDRHLPLIEAAELVSSLTGASFNAVKLNYYRTPEDHVVPHADRLEDLTPGSSIAILSLGATRRMTIASRRELYRSVDVDVAAGSIIYMDYVSQFHFLHGIGRFGANAGGRISLSFRQRHGLI